jgi:hypothetical protein
VSLAKKIRLRMQYERNELNTTLSDRVKMRKYVTDQLGSEYLPKQYALASNPTEIAWEQIPDQFVAKVTHGSGGLVGCWAGIDPAATLPQRADDSAWLRYWVNPVNFAAERINDILAASLQQNYAHRVGGRFEWGYLNAEPKVIIEELLLTQDGKLATQLQFYCFGGDVAFIRLALRDEKQNRSFAWKSPTWEDLPFYQVSWNFWNPGILNTPPPENLTQMIEIAGILAKNLEFARVDLYDLGDRVIVGEITLYPSGGSFYLVPHRFNRILGAKWRSLG